MAAKRTDLNHQFVALLEQSDFTLCGKRQQYPNFVRSVLLAEGEGLFCSRYRRRIFTCRIQHSGQLLQSLSSQDLVSEQGQTLHRNRRKVFFDLMQNLVL